MIRLFHLDGDALFVQTMDDYCSQLSDINYQGASSQVSLLQALDGDKPDVILLDLDFESAGGLANLGMIRERFSSTEVKVVLLAKEDTPEQTLSHMAASGADYFILRPVDLLVLEKRIRQLMGDEVIESPHGLTRREVKEICASHFEQMGIPPHYKGYRYLLEGIWLATVHPSWLNSVTQNLYPAIGQRFEVSGSQVERSMRYALDVTWQKGDLDKLYELFPFVRENKGKPTNSAFIAKMVDLVSLEAR